MNDQHKPLELPENRDKLIAKAIEEDGYCAAGGTPLGEALIESLTELRDALKENPDLGVGHELRRILLTKGHRITWQEARDLAIREAERKRQEAIERETEIDTWSDDGGQ